MRPTNESGISIVETVIALTIVAAIGGALMALNAQIQSVANSAKFKTIAESQVQRMQEKVRNAKNTGGGISSLGNGCYDSDLNLQTSPTCSCVNAFAMPSYSGIGKYQAAIKISDASNGKLIKTYVSWREKSKPNCLEVDSYLYDF